MILIKEWYVRHGLNARFYKDDSKYYIDYTMCSYTSCVSFTSSNWDGKYQEITVGVSRYVPKSYKRWVQGWAHTNKEVLRKELSHE